MAGRKATTTIINGEFALSVGKPPKKHKSGWPYILLTDVTELATGHTPSRKRQEYWNGDIPWMAVGDARKKDGKTIYTTKENTNKLGIENSAAVLLPKGTVCLSRTASIGYSIILGVDMATSQGFVNWLCSRLILPRFLQCVFLAEKRFLYSISEGTAHTTIYFPEVKAFHIALPTLPEQQRIVQKLDQLFGELDTIKKRYNNLITIKNTFITSCLINSETKKFYDRQTIGKYLEDSTERIGDNWAKYKKIGVSAKKGIIDLSVGQKKTFEKYKIVRPGDFIYNTMRVNIGSIAIYKGDEIAITSPDYVVFRVKSHLSSELLLGFLKSEQGILEIGANTKGSVRARLYFKSLSEVRMPVSDKEIQQKAELFLKSFNVSLAKLKTIIHSKIPKLEQAILAKAFTGELVSQLDTDGDACDLLKEIEALRTTISQKKKIKRSKAVS